jgi:hypothetical protein
MRIATSRPLSTSAIPLAVALLPLLTIHTCYLLSATASLIPLCVPYIAGCTSISAAGRHGLSYYLFKAGMLPAAVLTAACWWQARAWLMALGHPDNRALRAMAWSGITAAAFLALYTVFLGSKGDVYNLMRRFGVTFYFGGSLLAQLLLLARLHALRPTALPAWITRAMFALSALLLVMGIGSIPVSNFVADKDPIENAIEWNFCLMLTAWYLLLWQAWRQPARAVAVDLR